MPRKKAASIKASDIVSAEIVNQPITDTIEKNFMPYAMSVIVSRAIPDIDGFKPSHRKLLYTMYKMGLLTGQRTKSANVVGQTMRLNPHGDSSIYETLVRLTRGNESLLHPFVDSKGSFGKHYSSDMDYAASRYTEVKLDPICNEIFRGIDKNAVDFIPNYDNTMTEPTMLPTAFPNILVSSNLGVAVGMACSIASFNLKEICNGTIMLLKNPDTDIEKLIDTIPAPDFPSGANIIYDRDSYREIFKTGKGSVRLRAVYKYDEKANCIDVLQIPYSTSIELVLRRITSLIKDGRLKEVTDVRDEIDLSGFKLTIDLRRGTDPEKLMLKLFKLTPLEDSYDCNFNVLIHGTPKQLGIREILNEWINFRVECVKRELTFELERDNEKLHLLLGLAKILLDIDKAIKIVRNTRQEKDVVPNLMEGFGIDEVQAEYIAEIKLRNLNREYIMNRIADMERLQKEIENLEKTIASETRLKGEIAKQLAEIRDKYGKPRQSLLISKGDISEYVEEDYTEDYPVRLILTAGGFFKKITLQSLRGNDEQKLKTDDYVSVNVEAKNSDDILFFSDMAKVYKARASDFDPVKASLLGEYIPAKLGFDEGEKVIYMKNFPSEYPENKNFVFIFQNGKGVRIPAKSYETKSNRKRLTGAYSDVSPIVSVLYEEEPFDLMLVSDVNRAVLINSSLISEKTTRSSQGVQLLTLKKNRILSKVLCDFADIKNPEKYRKTKLPSTGSLLSEFDIEANQIKLQ